MTTKIRVRLYDDNFTTSNTSRYALAPMLLALRPFISDSVVTDKGHRHSRGLSEVVFWISSAPGQYHDIQRQNVVQASE
eukprot:6811563-Karenia_brevis.AAC.1